MIRIMGRGNGRPQALASVAYSYLCPSPFSGPWIHPTSPAHKPLSSFQPSFSFTFFLSPILSFHFLFLESFTFLEIFLWNLGGNASCPQEVLFIFLAIPGSFFLRDLVAFCRSYLNCYYITLKGRGLLHCP